MAHEPATGIACNESGSIMAGKTQGILVGCAVLASGFIVLLVVGIALLGGDAPWSDLGRGKIGLVMIEGAIGDVRGLVEEIDANRKDSSIAAVVVRINSPGGEVAPSQELHAALKRLAEEKPVVASLGSVAASGGYYAAVAADSIVANPGTLTGSIGVIFNFPTARQLLEKLGIEYHVFKSGSMKDLGSFSREPTEAEGAVFDAIIADTYEQFLEAVMDGRGLSRDEVLPLADGRVFTGRQAYEAGLVDRLGDLSSAFALAADMANLSGEPRIVRKTRPLPGYFHLLERLLEGRTLVAGWPTLQYRWR